jgi:hypothetical protein
MSVINKLGRRKSSVARIYLKSGKGKITINKRDHKDDKGRSCQSHRGNPVVLFHAIMSLVPQKSQYQRKKSSAAHRVGLCADLSDHPEGLYGSICRAAHFG